MKLSLVIPVYNEARSVHESARDLRSTLAYLRTLHETELILVDDGSRDDTAACLKAAFAGDPQTRIISHKRNTGIGAALRTGFQRAQGDVIITTDFDGTHPFNSIPLLVARLQVCEADIVTASPYHPQGSVQSLMLLGRAASLVYRLFINRRIHSWTSLYCAYRREVIKSVSFRDNGGAARL
jgi:dolichol-phosphate mannosyltransferase